MKESPIVLKGSPIAALQVESHDPYSSPLDKDNENGIKCESTRVQTSELIEVQSAEKPIGKAKIVKGHSNNKIEDVSIGLAFSITAAPYMY